MIEDARNNVRSTACAVIVKESKVLLVKRNHEPFNQHWTLPGGHIDFGETAEEAVVRETKEESGLEFKPKFLGYRDEIYPDINWHGEVLVFYGEASGNEQVDGKEIIDIKWFSIDEALNMDLAFDHEKTLKMYLTRRQEK
ncbi:MAG: NUDIX hydrolase [Nanoarchaeota archaeon]|nr:NUDIX hydrolase [Nanoarchaeota archaeon]